MTDIQESQACHPSHSILSPLDRESPHEAAKHPEARPGHGFRHGGDVLGDLGVGETLRGQHQQLREDRQRQVHQLDVQQQQECREVSYLQQKCR